MKRQRRMQQITGEEARQLLANMKHSRDDELSLRTSADAYVLEDGRVLLLYDEHDDDDEESMTGTVWESMAALFSTEVLTGQSAHILKDRLPYGPDFVPAVPQLISELALYLSLPASFFDYSQESVLALDKLIRDRIEPQGRIEVPIFAGVVAYISEVVIHRTGGRWDMRRFEDTDIWEPWIVAPSGEEYAPFKIVLKELYDHSDEIGCLLGAISSI